jgi:two-component system, OmpR family, KDP operon response regulator KdpE
MAVAAEAAGPGPGAAGGHRRIRVLVVADEAAMLRALRINLRARGYEVTTAGNGRDALAEAGSHPPAAVILDLGLPGVDGIEVIRGLRELSPTPVLVLSGRTGSGDKITAVDAGADDYVTKPFGMDELLARLRAVLRRDDPRPSPASLVIGRCTIDLAARRARQGTRPVRLTDVQWRLLEMLVRHPGQLLGTRRLLAGVGPQAQRDGRYLRFQMAGLRRKLEADPSRPQHLLTEPGMGYRYRP